MIDKKNGEKKFYEDMIEIISPYNGVDSGNDDFIYGAYLEWPLIRSLDENIIITLLEYFDLFFPFGERIDLSDLVKGRLLSNIPEVFPSIKSSIMEKVGLYDCDEELRLESDIWSLSIQFPELDDIHDEIAELLAKLGVPEGTKYENGGELNNYPEWTRYFAESEYSDYEYYSKFSSSYINFEDDMENIKKKLFEYENDELIVKSMILSAFIHTESFVKSKIVDKIPNIEDSVKNTHFKEILKNEIEKNLKTTDGRKKLFKKFNDNNKLKNIPNVELRNILAHDISSPSVKNKKIIFKSNEDNIKELEIELVINELVTYSSKLEHITN